MKLRQKTKQKNKIQTKNCGFLKHFSVGKVEFGF